jgi:DNA polymerase III subunit delta'
MTRYIGHDENMRAFSRAFSSGKLHHGWILAGPRGLGKAGFARKAAQMLVDAGGQYTDLIERGHHPDVITLERPPKEPPKEGEEIAADAERKRNINVDQIRQLQGRLTKRPGMADMRAIIIDAADDMERGAANALLKSLEEPPVGTYFFLISHASDRLLPTIRSRCQMLRFEPLELSQMEEALRTAEPDIDDAARMTLAKAGAGSPGQALEYLGLDIEMLENSMASIISTGDANNSLRGAMAAQLSLKAGQARYEAFLRRAPQLIAEHARSLDASSVRPAIDAWEAANSLALRAVGLSLDKPSVVLQMGSLLASLQKHKHRN